MQEQEQEVGQLEFESEERMWLPLLEQKSNFKGRFYIRDYIREYCEGLLRGILAV